MHSRIRLSWHQQTKAWRYAVAGASFLFTMLAWLLTRSAEVEGRWALRIGSLVFAVVCLGLLIEWVTEVDAQSRKVVNAGRLFGILPLYIRRHDFKEFTAVAIQSYRDSDDREYVYLELLRPRRVFQLPFVVQYAQSRSDAIAIGQALATATGLPFQDAVDENSW